MSTSTDSSSPSLRQLDITDDEWQILWDLITSEDALDERYAARLSALRRKLEAASGVIGGAA